MRKSELAPLPALLFFARRAERARLVLQEAAVPGVGRFQAFADGRVRVAFQDRTILERAADGAACSALLPDGSRCTFRADPLSSTPLLGAGAAGAAALAAHCRAAAEFAGWAYSTDEERVQALAWGATVAARVQAELGCATCTAWCHLHRLVPPIPATRVLHLSHSRGT